MPRCLWFIWATATLPVTVIFIQSHRFPPCKILSHEMLSCPFGAYIGWNIYLWSGAIFAILIGLGFVMFGLSIRDVGKLLHNLAICLGLIIIAIALVFHGAP